jgi:hypothetical protein
MSCLDLGRPVGNACANPLRRRQGQTFVASRHRQPFCYKLLKAKFSNGTSPFLPTNGQEGAQYKIEEYLTRKRFGRLRAVSPVEG